MQEGEAFVEGIEAAGLPGLEEAGQAQARGAAGGGAGAAADLALHDDGAQHALGAVVVGVEAVDAHEGEEFALWRSRRLARARQGWRFWPA